VRRAVLGRRVREHLDEVVTVVYVLRRVVGGNFDTDVFVNDDHVMRKAPPVRNDPLPKAKAKRTMRRMGKPSMNRNPRLSLVVSFTPFTVTSILFMVTPSGLSPLSK
jgi:hypothetical protein